MARAEVTLELAAMAERGAGGVVIRAGESLDCELTELMTWEG